MQYFVYKIVFIVCKRYSTMKSRFHLKIMLLPMKKISTLISSEAESMSVNVENSRCEMSPKADTIERIRRFARVAFSDAALAGMPLIILN